MSVHPYYAEEDVPRVREAKAAQIAVSSLRPEVKPLGWDVRWRQYPSSGDTSFRFSIDKGWGRDAADTLDRLVGDVKAANNGTASRGVVLSLFFSELRVDEQESDAPTLHEFAFDTFMPYALEELKPRTQAAYAHDIEELITQDMSYVTDSAGKYVKDGRRRRRVFTVSQLGATPIDRITKGGVVRRYNALRTKRGRRTCQLALGTLSSILGFAVEHEIIETNPAAGAGRRRAQRRKAKPVKPDRVLDPEQIELGRRYLMLRGRIRDWLMMALLAYLGLRPGEAVVLYWGELVDECGKAYDTIQLERSQSEGIEVNSTKTGDWRHIQVFEPVRRDIEWAYAQLGFPPRDSRVCLTRNGMLVRSTRWNEILTSVWKRLRLAHHCAYDLRHSAASYLGSGGDNEKGKPWSFTDIGVQLGHSPETCARIYQHIVKFKKYRGLTIEMLILQAKAAAEARLLGLDPTGNPIFADDDPAH